MSWPAFSFGYTSLYFFPFLFLTILFYWITPKKYRYITLLVCSLAFYGLMSYRSIPFLVVTTVSTYFFARAIAKNFEAQKAYIAAHKSELSPEEKKTYKQKQKKKRKTYLIFGILINVLLLCVMKYLGFFVSNVAEVINFLSKCFAIRFFELTLPLRTLGIVQATPIFQISYAGNTLWWFLPLGISFYVFQAIGYLVDVYWQKCDYEKNFAKFALFMCYFPKIMQGPIVRYEETKETLFGEHDFSYVEFTDGLKRMIYGYLKKLVIADTFVAFINFGFGNQSELSGLEAFLLVFFYFLQDYCDFSGYMDISIGISHCMGITLPENFRQPYFARGIDDYWRRWHITLGAWFKDYIFYPLSISRFSLSLGKKSKKVFKEFGKKIPAIFGLFVVWFLTGLWHGASWNYILWGLYYGFIIVLSVCFQPLINKFYEKTHCQNNVFWKLFQHLRTLFLLAIGKVIFMAPSLGDAWLIIAKCFSYNKNYIDITNINNQLGYLSMIFASVMGVVVLVVDIVQELKPNTSFLSKFNSKPLYVQWPLLVLLLVFVIWFGFYGSGLPHYSFGYIQF